MKKGHGHSHNVVNKTTSHEVIGEGMIEVTRMINQQSGLHQPRLSFDRNQDFGAQDEDGCYVRGYIIWVMTSSGIDARTG